MSDVIEPIPVARQGPRFMCDACKHGLRVRILESGHITGFGHAYKADHEPVPVAVDRDVYSQEEKIVCDFCIIPLVEAWDYPCEDFSVPTDPPQMFDSHGGWLACEACAEIIESGDVEALLDRCARMIAPPEDQEYLKRTNRAMHTAFMRLHAERRRFVHAP